MSVLSGRGPQPPTYPSQTTSGARPTAAQWGPSRPESTVRVAAAIRATVHAPTQWGGKA